MAHVLSANEFFNQAENPKLIALREALIAVPKEVWAKFSTVAFPTETISEARESQILNHQLYLFDKYSTVHEINANENFLLFNGYDPESLTENGTYQKALDLINKVNENLGSILMGFLKAMTEDFSFIGWIQFVLDIIGAIPGSWVGFPSDIVANAINAVISFARKNYLMFLINLVGCVGLGPLLAPFKIGVKTLAKPLSAAIKLCAKGSVEEAKLAAAALKTDAAVAKNPKMLKMFGEMLLKVSVWISETGLKLIKAIVPAIAKIVKKVTFGAVNIDKFIPSATKMMDDMAITLEKFGTNADVASKEILSTKTITAADKTIKVAADTVGDVAGQTAKTLGNATTKGAQNMVKGFASQTMLKKIGKVGGFTDDMVNGIWNSEKYLKLVKGGASDVVKEAYIYKEATRQLVEAVLSKKIGLLSLTKNKEIMSKLATGSTWRGAEKMIGDAIKTGNPEDVSKLINAMLTDPELIKLMTKTSPEIIKTLALFKEIPEALINGSKAFTTFSETGLKVLAKFPLRKGVFSAFIMFILKQCIKTECGYYLSHGHPAGMYDNIKAVAADKIASYQVDAAMTNVYEILSNVVFEQDDQSANTLQTLSKESLVELQKTNPEGYNLLMQTYKDVNASTEKLKAETNPKNPCSGATSVGQGEAGLIFNTNSTLNKAYQQGQVVRDMTKPEDFGPQGTNLNNYTKGILGLLKQDTNIDAQHPLSNDNPEIKAYFSDVVTPEGKIELNTQDESRLDATLDAMIKDGTMKSEDRDATKKLTMSHWQNGTVPASMIEPVKPAQVNESTNGTIFRVGKLTAIKK